MLDTNFLACARGAIFEDRFRLARTKIKQLAENEKAEYTRENVSEKNETTELLAGGRKRKGEHTPTKK